VSKFALVDAGIADDHHAVVGVSLVVSLLTLFAMTRIWMGAFWSPPEVEPQAATAPTNRSGGPGLMVAPTLALLACSLAVAAAAGPVYAFSERAAHDLLDREAYIAEVLDR
jgi:multicomponent Na+:H+ antiporter subunit D